MSITARLETPAEFSPGHRNHRKRPEGKQTHTDWPVRTLLDTNTQREREGRKGKVVEVVGKADKLEGRWCWCVCVHVCVWWVGWGLQSVESNF